MTEMPRSHIIDYKSFYNYLNKKGTLNEKDERTRIYLKTDYPEHCKILEREVDAEGFDYSLECEGLNGKDV